MRGFVMYDTILKPKSREIRFAQKRINQLANRFGQTKTLHSLAMTCTCTTRNNFGNKDGHWNSAGIYNLKCVLPYNHLDILLERVDMFSRIVERHALYIWPLHSCFITYDPTKSIPLEKGSEQNGIKLQLRNCAPYQINLR